MTDAGPLFLGFDLSSQGLKAVLITEDSEVTHESAVNFDRDLPQYGTTKGAIVGPVEGEVTSPVAMFLEAMDLLLTRMRAAGVDFARIAAVSGAGQVRRHSHHLCSAYVTDQGHDSNTAQSTGLATAKACSTPLTPQPPYSTIWHQAHSHFPTRLSGKTRAQRRNAARLKPR